MSRQTALPGDWDRGTLRSVTPQGDVGLAKGRADGGEWRAAGGGGIDSTRPYVVRASPGRRMAGRKPFSCG